MRVALFGGSFNPPHVAHQMVALWALETQPIDEVWFVPVYKHAFNKDLEAFEHRVEMTRLAAERFGAAAKVIDAEKDNASGRTYDLLVELTTGDAADPSRSFRLLVGTDILAESHKWHRWDDVIAMAPLMVIARAGHLPAGQETTFAAPSISSTQIRELLKAVQSGPMAERSRAHDEVASLLPAAVLRYIDAHSLYRLSR
jgi:nicotinate-nucleotide adenylyltransferase